ncbi:MAG: hypothetical protein ACLGGV_00550 [Bacteroidia bacterium]
MKKVFYALTSAALLTVGIIACSKEDKTKSLITYDKLTIETTDKKGPTVTFNVGCDIARPKYNCEKGVWLCNCEIDISVDLFGISSGGGNNDSKNKERMTLVGFEIGSLNNQKFIVIDFNQEEHIAKGEQFFFAETGEDFVMPKEISSRLGYRELVLKSGQYIIDYDRNPNGSVIIELAKAVK